MNQEEHTSNDIRFKTTMLTSSLCDYADPYIHTCKGNYNNYR